MPGDRSRLRAAASASRRDAQAVDVLLEEYRQLYALALFRLSALDQRVPIAGAGIAAVTGVAASLPPGPSLFWILVLPLGALWLVRVTVNHARSFEDALRRIEQIEGMVNAAVGRRLLAFQSSHPSRLAVVGGRTGLTTIEAVIFAGCTTVLGTMGVAVTGRFDPWSSAVYGAYAVCVLTAILREGRRWSGYRYHPDVGDEPQSPKPEPSQPG